MMIDRGQWEKIINENNGCCWEMPRFWNIPVAVYRSSPILLIRIYLLRFDTRRETFFSYWNVDQELWLLID